LLGKELMSLDRAQGVNNAIQDAANYVDAMKKVRDGADMKEIMVAYDEEIVERGRREIALAIPQAMASHSVSAFAKGPLATIGLKQKIEEK
jgi:2-polyprenyl-6-methoxyphenol hydroxylase-like FAD-dependent oxidoreductase